MRSLFAPERLDFDARTGGDANAPETQSPSPSPDAAQPADGQASAAAPPAVVPPPILSEAQALREVPAVPVYFATSYSLVKPYVQGFDANALDAPSLQRVRIDTSGSPPRATRASRCAASEHPRPRARRASPRRIKTPPRRSRPSVSRPEHEKTRAFGVYKVVIDSPAALSRSVRRTGLNCSAENPCAGRRPAFILRVWRFLTGRPPQGMSQTGPARGPTLESATGLPPAAPFRIFRR